jgi:hypothetical protein
MDEMLTDHEIGGTMIAQSFVDYCQALINGEVIETDGSEFFQLLEDVFYLMVTSIVKIGQLYTQHHQNVRV